MHVISCRDQRRGEDGVNFLYFRVRQDILLCLEPEAGY